MHVRVGVGDVFAEHADALVARHLLVQREPDRLAERDRLGASASAAGSPGIVGDRRAARRRGRARSRARAAARRARPRPRRAPSRSPRRASRRPRSGVSAPRVDQLAARARRSGRARASSASSSAPRYFLWSSESECEYGPRHQRVDRGTGPAPARTCAIASAPLRAHLEVVAAVHLHDVQPADAAHHLARSAPGAWSVDRTEIA